LYFCFYLFWKNTLVNWIYIFKQIFFQCIIHKITVFFCCCYCRISLTLACPMDLRLYPLDKQVCVLQIASCKFSYTKKFWYNIDFSRIKQISYTLILIETIKFFLHKYAKDGWAKDDLIYTWKEKDPVQVVPGLHLPRFTLEQYKSAYCDVITNTGTLDS
jgi:hypothetical protein